MNRIARISKRNIHRTVMPSANQIHKKTNGLSLQRSDMSIEGRYVQSPRSRGAQCVIGDGRIRDNLKGGEIGCVGVGSPNPLCLVSKPLDCGLKCSIMRKQDGTLVYLAPEGRHVYSNAGYANPYSPSGAICL